VPALSLDSPVRALPDCGTAVSERLGRVGIRSVRDLLLHLPYDFDDYGTPQPVAGLRPGALATVVGTLASIGFRKARNRPLDMAEGVLRDDEGDVLNVVWFNQPWLRGKLRSGQRIAVAGALDDRRWMSMVNPKYQPVDGGPIEIGGLEPRYHTVDKLPWKKIAELVEVALPLAKELEDPLPEEVRRRQRLLALADAVRLAHKPRRLEEWKEARRRVVFEELFELQAAFALIRRQLAVERADPISYNQDVIERFKAGLGFELTRAQKRAAWDVFKDMQLEQPMNRLLNGDVGSGKTAVAAAAAAMVHAAAKQTVVMAPTEILARQHLHKFRAYLEATFPDLKVELLVSDLPAAEKRRVRMAAASGHCGVLVGTHALLEEAVELADLGLAVVDEQHRFGTKQREALRRKGKPHFLAMTATPIPRTLALALYGEMTVSVIDEMPPGRTPVGTAVVPPDARNQAYVLVRREVAASHQVFVICPLIEESDTLQVKAATAEYERLRTKVFPDVRLGLVHGRLKDKDAVMRGFLGHDFDILVATAVVEVGVDVPNATVMLIEGAERFGLAQLHQFRGRVGRGAAKAHCLLFAEDPTETALKRLRLMETVHDGFRLAEEDMRLRGAGELLGSKQHGMTDQAMRGLFEPNLLNEVREEAERIVEADPTLERSPALKAAIDRRLELTSIS
jgi:ATP-dependent DNA helicase RecG